ncbi:MAG: sortase [Acidimicrobiia bacterium]|nr:sortase [Acidimicrobiia bacterium]
MTQVLDPSSAPPAEVIELEPDAATVTTPSDGDPARASLPGWWPTIQRTTSMHRIRVLFVLWFVAIVAGMALVVYGLGPFFQQRDQHGLMKKARADISRAANESTGLLGVTVPTKAVSPGSPAGILEIGQIKLQQVVVEGVGPEQTRAGPGHVPGTAGLGQPGNSVVVARRTAFGGPFHRLGDLKKGKSILVTTNQGESVYRIVSVRHRSIHGGSGDSNTSSSSSSDSSGTSSTIDSIYGPTKDDRLTLVTSANALPWNQGSAVVVVAKMDGTAFAPTPQGARLDSDIGTQRDSGAPASIVIALILYGLTITGSLLLYRRLQPRTAYLLTIGPVLAMTIIAAETLSRAFPAWL